MHRLRKALKRARSSLRLLRFLVPARSRRIATGTLRDVARTYATARDGASLVEALARIARRNPSVSMARAGSATGRALRARRLRARRTLPDPTRRAALLRQLRAIRSSVAGWKLGTVARAKGAATPTSCPVARALKRIYRRARRAGRRAAGESTATLHAWRTEVKCLHYALLAMGLPARPPESAAFVKRSDRLGEALGCEHDLSLLEAAILAQGLAVPVTETPPLIEQIRRERKHSLARALRESEHLFHTRPRQLVRALGLARTPD